jgi:hypothetical protein
MHVLVVSLRVGAGLQCVEVVCDTGEERVDSLFDGLGGDRRVTEQEAVEDEGCQRVDHER